MYLNYKDRMSNKKCDLKPVRTYPTGFLLWKIYDKVINRHDDNMKGKGSL